MKTAILLAAIATCGCTRFGAKHAAVLEVQQTHERQLVEESRALTTGIVDVLSLAPTNAHSQLALDLATHDQQIEGLPLKRMEVLPLLLKQESALAALEARYAAQEQLLQAR